MRVVNDKFRVRFWIPYTDLDFKAEFYNDNKQGVGQ